MFKRKRKLDVSVGDISIDIREPADQSVLFGFLTYDTTFFGLLVHQLFGKYNHLILTKDYIKYTRKDRLIIDENINDLSSIDYSSISSTFNLKKGGQTTKISIEELKPKYEEHQLIKQAAELLSVKMRTQPPSTP